MNAHEHAYKRAIKTIKKNIYYSAHLPQKKVAAATYGSVWAVYEIRSEHSSVTAVATAIQQRLEFLSTRQNKYKLKKREIYLEY